MTDQVRKRRRMPTGSIRRMVITALLIALTIVLGTTPLGLVPIGPVAVTTLHIPVLIGVLIEGPVVGLVVGLTFGLFSLARAFMPAMPMDVFFQNPLVSVVPRLLLPLVAYGVAKLVGLFMRPERRGFAGLNDGAPRSASVIMLGVSAGVATLAHTVMVLGAIGLLYAGRLVEMFGLASSTAVLGTLGAVVVTNGLPECALSVVLVSAICKPLLLLKRK